MARETVKPTQTRFGRILKEARERAPRYDGGIGYSQKEVEQLSLELADKFPHSEPISHSHLSSVEGGRHRMTDAMLRMLIYLYKMDDSTIVNLMKLPDETRDVKKPIPLYADPATPDEALPLLQQLVNWASQGAALEQYRNLRNSGVHQAAPDEAEKARRWEELAAAARGESGSAAPQSDRERIRAAQARGEYEPKNRAGCSPTLSGAGY